VNARSGMKFFCVRGISQVDAIRNLQGSQGQKEIYETASKRNDHHGWNGE
jgi:hypothetical protein